MDLATARARIHAMLPILDNPTEADAREAQMDQRIDDLVTAATGAAAAIDDFFQVGRTYHRFVGDRDLYFRVTSVSNDNPNSPNSLDGNGPVAWGWVRTDRSLTAWGPSGKTNFSGWRDVTDELTA
jgi:hypothetical protein